jgi:hypothetical protein
MNVSTGANTTYLTVSTLANVVSANIVTSNLNLSNTVTANILNMNVSTGANTTYLTVSQFANIQSSNTLISNIQNLNVYTGANTTYLTVSTLANVATANIVTGNLNSSNTVSANILNLNVSTGANITQLTVTTQANISSLNVSTGANTTYLTVSQLANIVSANIVTENVQTLNSVFSNILNLNVSTGANTTYLTVSQLANIASANIITENVQTLNSVFSNILNLNVSSGANITQLTVTTQANISSANIVTENVQSLNSVFSNILNLNVSSGANITQLTVTTQANISSANILTLNVKSSNIQTDNVVFLNVSTSANVTNLTVISNIVPSSVTGNTYITGNIIVSGNVYSQIGSPLGSGGGYYLSLSSLIVTQSPYTGPVGTAYPLSVGLSNGFTINGTSTLITITPNGNFKFNTAGPYLLNAVFYSGDNITGLALGSNSSDVHGTDQSYMYRYMTQITQNPTELIEIPFNITDTNKYYYLDLFSTAATRLYETANTTGGGTYLTITPLQGGGLATGGPGGTPGTQWISSGINIYYSNSVGIGAVNPAYQLDVSGDIRATGNVYSANPVIKGKSTSYAVGPLDYYIGMNGTGLTVTLPLGSTLPIGKTYFIKDESGNALTNNITLAATSPNLIDGSSSVIINRNYMALQVIWSGTFWSII